MQKYGAPEPVVDTVPSDEEIFVEQVDQDEPAEPVDSGEDN